jgi:hypothetical protein
MAKAHALADAEQGRVHPPVGQNQVKNAAPPPRSKAELLDSASKAARDEVAYLQDGRSTVNLATVQRLLLFQLRVDIMEKVGKLFNPNNDDGNGDPLGTLRKDVADYGRTAGISDLRFPAILAADGRVTQRKRSGTGN